MSEPVVVITGASRGIGAHLREAFGAAGYLVEGLSRSGDAGTTQVDVTDEEAVAGYVEELMRSRGRVDVLINNAGLIDAEVPLWEADPAQWWRTVEVNVRGPFLLSRAISRHMLAAGGGRIINLNSGAGTRANDVATAYYASKTALGRITGGLHLAGYERGLRAFDLAPGVVRTDMTAAMSAHEGRTEWTQPSQVSELALALASGRLDDWSGRMVRAGVDTAQSLATAAAGGLDEQARTVGLRGWGAQDPIS
ncbi:SDR family oxidoreductase [Gephyromycinifex aptenodytis]|uniref:SDR family oxidoreductase n=1 Tax=Gephyromycinifex aptenodytis TaxID=2716227 RepID=UPI0014472768|nr:SDR family oxidoreductase [Gephyromycinifex aptenodytis]